MKTIAAIMRIDAVFSLNREKPFLNFTHPNSFNRHPVKPIGAKIAEKEKMIMPILISLEMGKALVFGAMKEIRLKIP